MFTQEIIFQLSTGHVVQSNVEKNSSGFIGEYILAPYREGGTPSIARSPRFVAVDVCFKWIVGEIVRYASRQGAEIVKLSNPCVPIFILKDDQVEALSQLGVAAVVEAEEA